MQPLKDKTSKMFFGTESEVFDLVVKEGHVFRKLEGMIDFSELTDPLRKLYSDMGTTGIDIELESGSRFGFVPEAIMKNSVDGELHAFAGGHRKVEII